MKCIIKKIYFLGKYKRVKFLCINVLGMFIKFKIESDFNLNFIFLSAFYYFRSRGKTAHNTTNILMDQK